LLDPAKKNDRIEYTAYFSIYLKLLKEIAFQDLGLNRLFTETYATREHHISVLEAAGMRLEGIMRKHVIVDGLLSNSLIHGYLRSDDER
jgi:RimJ/RimL family protein N-acetyltransferase